MSKTLKILALADGFGDSVACPPWYPQYHKWPSIMGLMTKNTEIIDLCRYGAGNEYITNCLRHNHAKADVVFIQWAIPGRLDLMLPPEHKMLEKWDDMIKTDLVYRDNFQMIGQDRWWISSGSALEWVKEYHGKFISTKQHKSRSKIWVEYAHNLLADKPHGFMLTEDSPYLDDAQVDPNVWIWHRPWKGMHSWRQVSQYRDLDLGVTQPIPLIHFDFVKNFIMPKFDLPWRGETELQAVESMLLRKYNQYKDSKPK